jgi:hypothetical protein
VGSKALKASIVAVNVALITRIDVGIPLLDRHKIKATFYVSLNNLDKRLADWKAVAAGRGHDSCAANTARGIMGTA